MKIAVALHLFNLNLLQEYVTALANIEHDYDLYITVPDEGIPVRRAFPSCYLYTYQPNQGMDLGSFFTLLPIILQQNYDYVLKLHTKTDDRWRKALVNSCCGTKEQVELCLRELSKPEVGMVGCGDLLFRDGKSGDWKANQAHMEEIAELHSVPLQPSSFIGGTMFWIKVSALRHIFTIVPSLDSFNTLESLDWAWYRSFYKDLKRMDKEQAINHWNVHGKYEQRVPNGLAARGKGLQDRVDGMIEHAYERLFGLGVTGQGLIVKGVPVP